MVRQIVTVPNPVLRQKATKVADFKDCQSLVNDLFDSMRENNGVGLAAPQIGVSQQMAVVYIDEQVVKERYGKVQPDIKPLELVLINPKIINRSKTTTTETEGCLSLPDIEVDVTRPDKIEIINHNLNGTRHRLKLDNFPARVVQHEIDHLNGILITDYGQPK